MTKSQHPISVYWLLLTHALERFGFWGMRGLLILYMIEAVSDGGLGWSEASAIEVTGWLGGVLYAMPMIGGMLADFWMGGRAAVIAGAGLMALGIGMLAANIPPLFYVAILLVSVGNGLFKPCITATLGRLYDKEDSTRESGYQYLYQTVLLGVLGSGLVCGWLQPNYGFKAAFGAAAGAMLLASLLWLFAPLPKKLLDRKECNQREEDTSEHSTDWLLIGQLLTFAIIFFVIQAQGGGTVTVFVHRYTERTLLGWEIPTLWLTTMGTWFGIGLTPIVSRVWMRREEGGHPVSVKRKLGLGMTSRGLSFLVLACSAWFAQLSGAKAAVYWLIAFHVADILGKLIVIPVLFSTVQKAAPPRMRYLLMGANMACVGAGNVIGGQVGKLFGTLELSTIFLLLAGLAGLAAAAIRWSDGSRPEIALA